MNSEHERNKCIPATNPASQLHFPKTAVLLSVVLGLFGGAGLIQWLRADTRLIQAPPAAAPNWLQGGEEDKFETISKHLRGLDMAMVETGYRYGELYWAGQDRNWDFAAYQLEKIRLTLELSLERRPKRAASAQLFSTVAVPQMKEAIEKKDPELFRKRFEVFTTACNTCHAMEQVPFMHVRPPAQRLSVIGAIPRANAPSSP
jgi:hypothetical protein